MKNMTNFKGEMIGWLILPILTIWFSASYLLGVSRQPVWQEQQNQGTPQVLAAIDEPIAAIGPQEFVWSGTGLVTLWFDDAWISQYQVAAPLLKQKGLTGAVAVPTKLMGYEAYMTWGQLKRLRHFYNWEVTAHSRTHNCESQEFTQETLQNEVVGSSNDLLAQGYLVNTYVVPCGKTTEEMAKLVKDNFAAMRIADNGLNPLPLTDSYQILANTIHDGVELKEVKEWLNEANTDKKWLILMFHQIDESGDEYSLSPQKFKDIVELVIESQLPVVLPSQVFEITCVQRASFVGYIFSKTKKNSTG